uniref:Secreted protein n=1 Tax=Steinernema glaseri TaxID=37863 RepID=A0A1I7ZH18_9BILA
MTATSWGSILSFLLSQRSWSSALVFGRIFDFVLCLRAILIPLCITRGNRHLFNHMCRAVGVAYRIESSKESMLDHRPPREKSEAYFSYLEKAWHLEK